MAKTAPVVKTPKQIKNHNCLACHLLLTNISGKRRKGSKTNADAVPGSVSVKTTVI
jgi:hypothetical protein